MRPKVNVVGWYGKNNVGDEAYKLAFPAVFPHAHFVFSEKPISGCDATVLGGGDVVNIDNLKRLRSASGRKFIMSTTVSVAYDAAEYKGNKECTSGDDCDDRCGA